MLKLILKLPSEIVYMDANQLLAWAMSTYRDRFAIATSFQAEGMVLLDMALRLDPAVRILTIDTGRLPEATHEMIETVRNLYGARIEVIAPEASEIERMVTLHGVNLFRKEAALRKLCCHVRKVRPMERKIEELDCWAVGLRREQSEERAGAEKIEDAGGKLKLSPLVDWTQAEVESYLSRHNVPRHPLYGLGYRSIGCAPCTRAVLSGEDERAGRWWWESEESKECGLHVTPEGEVRRSLDILLEEIVVQ